MPLRKVLAEAPLSSGLNQKADQRELAVDGAVAMTNCSQTKQGGIRKRIGCRQLTSTLQGKGFTVTENNVVRGVNYGRAPLIFDGYKFSTYSDSRAGWTLIDAAPEAVADVRIPIAAVLGLGGDVDYASTSTGYYVSVFPILVAPGTTNIQAVIIDATSGATVDTSTVDNSGVTGLVVKVAVCGNLAIVAFMKSPGGVIGLYLSKIDLTNIPAGWSAPVLFDTPMATAGSLFDLAAMTNDSTRFVVGYFKGGNVLFSKITAATFAGAGGFSKTPLTAGTPLSIAVLGFNLENCWCAYSILNGGGGHTYEEYGFNDSSNVAWNPVVLNSDGNNVGFAQIGIARVSATDAVVFWTEYATGGSPPYRNSVVGQQLHAVAGVSNTVGVLRKTFGVMLCSKPQVVQTPEGQRCYALVNTNSSLQGTQSLFCFDWFGQGALPFTRDGNASNAPGRQVCTVAPRLAKSLGVSAGDTGPGGVISVPKLALVNATTLATVVFINQTFTSVGMFIQTFDFNAWNRYFGGTIAGSNLAGLSAGVPFTYDEQSPAEMGFLWYPECTASLVAAGALTGTFSYIVCYEWTDAIGNLHRGATSPPINVAPAGQNVSIIIPTMGSTWRQRNVPTVVGTTNSVFQNVSQLVKIVIYRTASLGSIYYKFDSVDNRTDVGTITYLDNASLALKTTNPLLYTTGGVLDNYNPGSAKICITHKNRWFLAGCDEPTLIWPSKALTVGETPGFNEQMNFNATGAVTAMASMDEKLIIFVRRGNDSYGIEYVVGDGPLDTGAANDFTNPPQPIPSAVGAVDQRSIAVSELGCFFLAPIGAPNNGGGIYLLSRDLQVHYLSGPVEDIMALNPVCTGVLVHPSNGSVYFEFAPTDAIGASTDGFRLVYDYINGGWSTDTHFSYVNSNDGCAARTTWIAGGLGSTVSGGTANQPLVYWADYSGSVYRENSGVPVANAYIDMNAAGNVSRWITMSFTSAWFKPALAGFARFWRAQIQSDRLDPAQLTIAFQFDYANAAFYTESSSWTDAQIATFNRLPQVDVEHLVGNQKAKAIQVTLTDAQPVGSYSTGQGFQWATISLELGVEDQGRYMNLPSGQRS